MGAQSDWPLLSEAFSRLDADAVYAARDIIARGQVPVTAIRSDTCEKTPGPVEELLRKAMRADITIMVDNPAAILEVSAGAASPLPFDSEIAAYFDRRDGATFLLRSNLFNREFYPQSRYDVEIKFFRARVHWSSLVQALASAGFGVPAGAAVKPQLEAAIKTVLNTHGVPGREVPWSRFCDLVRKECNVTATTRGYGDKSIERGVRRIAADQDKPDIADMSDMSC